MIKLSVNVNKIATLRNSRGGDVPNVLKVALDCEKFGADGITVHPRPDERHIRYSDVYVLKSNITTEFNIEGNPVNKFIDLIERIKPTQVTLVPDAPDALTSNAGWDCIEHFSYLSDLVTHFKELGVRVSIFVGTDIKNIEAAAKTDTDRIELYTEPYASLYRSNPEVWAQSECRTRPEFGKLKILCRQYPDALRGKYRTRTNSRCSISGTCQNYCRVQKMSDSIIFFS